MEMMAGATVGPSVRSGHSELSTQHSALPFVLASGSPRRRELLAEAGFEFDVIPSDVDESDVPPGTAPPDLAEWLAVRKASAVAARFPDRVVLAADTVVALGKRAIGKPADEADALALLHALAGSTHAVVTGVCLARAGATRSLRVSSAVKMKPMTDEQIRRLVASGQWRGKAGGYGIQDAGDDPFVERLSGSFTNIIGLPMEQTVELLAQAGVVPAPPAVR